MRVFLNHIKVLLKEENSLYIYIYIYIYSKDLMQESKSMKFIELVNKINGYINYL